jgi:hypothetical protein
MTMATGTVFAMKYIAAAATVQTIALVAWPSKPT